MFAVTCTDAVQIADSAELAAVACNRGVAHPPGYPLYTLVGRAFCAIPVSTPAARLSLLSLFAGLWALWGVYAIGFRLTQTRWAAAVSALVAATGWLFWRYSSLPEVFALNAALCVAVAHMGLVAVQSATDARRMWAVLVMGVLFGLALSNHHSCALLGLLPAWVVLVPLRPYRQTIWRAVLALGGLMLGLLPYLHLLLADPLALPRWGNTDTLTGLVHHLLRSDYGTFQLGLHGESSAWATLVAFGRTLPAQLGWVFLPVAAAGLVLALVSPKKCWSGGESAPRGERSFVRLLVVSLVLCGPAFMLLFNIQPEGIGLQVVERFFVLPSVLLAVFVGLGLAWIDRRWLSEMGQGRARFYRLATLALLAPVALHNYARADVRENYAVEDYAHNVLRAADKNALVLGTGDLRIFSLSYAQHVLGIRRDVQYVDVRLLLYPWYVAQQNRLFPRFGYRYQKGNVNTLGLIHSHLQRGIPVYLAEVYNKKVAEAFASYPVGPLQRLVAPGDPLPTVQDLARLNAQLEARLWRRGRLPDPDTDPWSASLRVPIADTWYTIGRVALITGQPGLARRSAARARSWAPWLARPPWLHELASARPTHRGTAAQP